MSIRFRSSGRKVSPPGPTFMSDDQLAQYLKDLRNNRPPRPNGSRPLPQKAPSSLSTNRDAVLPRASSALSTSRPLLDNQTHLNSGDPVYPRASSALSHRQGDSQVLFSSASSAGQDHEAVAVPEVARALSPTPSVLTNCGPSCQYRESGQRWMEREEARSLRYALEEMDFQDEEKRLHAAAQEEATELVMQHQRYGFAPKNPFLPYKNPDRLRSQGGHARSQSLGGYDDSLRSRGSRSMSGSSDASLHGSEIRSPSTSSLSQRNEIQTGRPDSASDLYTRKDATIKRKSKVNFAVPQLDIHPASSSYRKNGTRARTPSGDSSKGIFRNPEDSIYEEPEDSDDKPQADTNDSQTIPAVLSPKPRNSLTRGARPPPPGFGFWKEKAYLANKNNTYGSGQTHKPVYTSNKFTSPSTATEQAEPAPSTKDGIEIRGDDIRAATSKKLKDRSSKLPTPSAVSDRPGRPIVSFDPDWKAPEEGENTVPPEIEIIPPEAAAPSTSQPAIPIISVSDTDDNGTPAISVSAPSPAPETRHSKGKQSTRPLPTPVRGNANGTFRQRKYNDSSFELRGHLSLHGAMPTASCAACGLPISGRIVTASNCRLHPECFSCHHCSTPLECVAFYEEPAAKREERLATSELADEDAQTPRFYCHLDFHELFSPRCKHCKTPIEGEVIVACGAEWHTGHFFCAECGDPFNSSTPFVENSGYAWCLKCHSRRTASKCRGCRLPVMEDVVITALGGDWHEKCFVCSECNGGFGPDGRFFVREGQPRFTTKGRQIGGPVQLAVCEGCESRRLRA